MASSAVILLFRQHHCSLWFHHFSCYYSLGKVSLPSSDYLIYTHSFCKMQPSLPSFPVLYSVEFIHSHRKHHRRFDNRLFSFACDFYSILIPDTWTKVDFYAISMRLVCLIVILLDAICFDVYACMELVIEGPLECKIIVKLCSMCVPGRVCVKQSDRFFHRKSEFNWTN